MKPLTVALLLESQGFRNAVLEAMKEIPVRILLDQGGFTTWHLVREKLERLRPDVILVDLGEQPEQRFIYLQAVRTMPHAPAIVVLHGSSDANVILNAMRAGATEFLTMPLEPLALLQALERISALLPAGPSTKETGGRVLAFLGAKGGTGATTLACNVAALLGKTAGQETLLADLDIEGGTVSFAMKVNGQYSIVDACRSISRLDTHYWRGLISNGWPGLHILGAPSGSREFDLLQPVEVQQVLNFARSLYKYSVVDLASTLSRFTLAVLEDADQIFVITTAELPALHLAKRTLQRLGQAGYDRNRLFLVVNRSSRRDEVSVEDIERNMEAPVFWRFPSDSKSVTAFYMKGGAITSDSDLGKSIRQFVKKITGSPGSAKKSSLFGR